MSMQSLLAELSALVREQDELSRSLDNAAIDGDGANIIRLRSRRDELSTLIPSAEVRVIRAEMATIENAIAAKTATIPELDREDDEARARSENSLSIAKVDAERRELARTRAAGARVEITELRAALASCSTRLRAARRALVPQQLQASETPRETIFIGDDFRGI